MKSIDLSTGAKFTQFHVYKTWPPRPGRTRPRSVLYYPNAKNTNLHNSMNYNFWLQLWGPISAAKLLWIIWVSRMKWCLQHNLIVFLKNGILLIFTERWMKCFTQLRKDTSFAQRKKLAQELTSDRKFQLSYMRQAKKITLHNYKEIQTSPNHA